uniref:TauD/TfdA-like domain-containing protein n=1 Tax=Chromera velia CCMP2878 TaxID=1169474 RepID=A0A0G4H6J9_9ALVE|eukprot:Cvel_24818.t1-p1 / transcript=Cvel_24818.t1 / gene=Cvel_24818 / organism=Chromera_velia_CCMP2878 / gene_product=hypothetical protein / transcript_product=hypothetical protein / location=Cvel_scaffold2734:20814-23992(+) / protein_length=598 / sequence_SO=supercontig / SO=protein_coding / is_pseudo=false
MLKVRASAVSSFLLVFYFCRAASGGIEYLPFAYNGPVLHNVTREGSLSAALYEKVGTSGLSDEVKQALERLRGGESSVVVLRGPGRLEGVPPTPLSVRASWEHIGPPALFSSVASIAHYLGSPLAYSIFGRNVTFLRHVHPLVTDKDSFMNDHPLDIHTDFVCFPMTPQFAIYAMLRPDNEGRPEEREGEDESAGFYVSPLDAALSSLRSSLGDERFQTVLSELMEPDWSFKPCEGATWRRHVDRSRSHAIRAGPRPIVFQFPSPSPTKQGERSEVEGGGTEERDTGTSNSVSPEMGEEGGQVREGREVGRGASFQNSGGPLHFVLGLDVVKLRLDRTGSESSYALLKEALKENRVGMRMRAGDIVVVDNTRAAHGREAFKVPKRLDGSDRWLYRAFSNDRDRFYSYLDEMLGVPSGAFMKEGTIEVDQEEFIRIAQTKPMPPRKPRTKKPLGPRKSERDAKRSRRQRRSAQQRQNPGASRKHRSRERERTATDRRGGREKQGKEEAEMKFRDAAGGVALNVQRSDEEAEREKNDAGRRAETDSEMLTGVSSLGPGACSGVAAGTGRCPMAVAVEPSKRFSTERGLGLSEHSTATYIS